MEDDHDDEVDFRKLLSMVDDMPPLWPRPPKWPFDTCERDAALATLNMGTIEMKNHLALITGQRKKDIAWRHFCYLAEQRSGGGPDAVQPVSVWADCMKKSGYSTSEAWHRNQTRCTSYEAATKIFIFKQLDDMEHYKPPDLPISKCDLCRKPCTSECGICGEVYCSRACMKKEWNLHKSVCRLVWENGGNLTSLVTQIEMNTKLSSQEMDFALGVDRDPNTGEARNIRKCNYCCRGPENLLRCSRCKRVKYCSKVCQSFDWKEHKKSCKPFQK